MSSNVVYLTAARAQRDPPGLTGAHLHHTIAVPWDGGVNADGHITGGRNRRIR